MNHKVIRVVVALAVGSALALYAYERSTDPLPRQQRQREETVVIQVRDILTTIVAPGSALQFVDPVNPDRNIGKVYISPTDDGWDVSGHYRRNEADPWHPWLMSVDTNGQLQKLRVKDSDPQLVTIAAKDARLDAVP